MSKMIIETIERLSIDVFVTAMAITAVVIATIALSLLASPFANNPNSHGTKRNIYRNPAIEYILCGNKN